MYFKYIIFISVFLYSCSFDPSGNASKDMFIEDIALEDLIYNSSYKDGIIYDYFYERKNVYVVLNKKTLTLENMKKASQKFPDIQYIGNLKFWFYSFFFKSEVMLYAKSDSMIEYALKNKINCARIVSDLHTLKEKEILSLKDELGFKIIITSKEKPYININKSNIYVIDGDTIVYNSVHYRLIGFDAPEINQEWGEKSRDYLINMINKSANVIISPFEYDIYGRVLAHIFINEKPIAYYMIESKMAKENITKYGDSDYTVIASNIIVLARAQGRLPFLSPSVFRKNVALGKTNYLKTKTGLSVSKKSGISAVNSESIFNLTPDILMSNKKD